MIPGSFSTTPFPCRFLIQLLKPSELVVYQDLCSRVDNGTGRTRVSNARLARETGFSKSYVKRAKGYLVWLGLLRVYPRTNLNGGQGVSTTEVVDIPSQPWLFALNLEWHEYDWENPVPDPRKDEMDIRGGAFTKSGDVASPGYQRRFIARVLSEIALGGELDVEPADPRSIIKALAYATRGDGDRPTLVQRVAAELRTDYARRRRRAQ